LTGALDTAAEFVGAYGPIDVRWDARRPFESGVSLAFDSGTRELDRDDVIATVSSFVNYLDGGTIAFKKIDSLLRGHWAAELAACLRSGAWECCLLAPAFPHQGRRTSQGHQYARDRDGLGWHPVGDDLVAAMEREGFAGRLMLPGEEIREGLSILDASTEADLGAAVQVARRSCSRILWCGSGGLAQAMARGCETTTSTKLTGPVLGLFGSDHIVSETQLNLCGGHFLKVRPDVDMSRDVQQRLDESAVALVGAELPAHTPRPEATDAIAAMFGRLVVELPQPGTLIASGGQTLKALCLAVGATGLCVTGRLAPGIPRSRMVGGCWDGVEVVSKSGAFGVPTLWRDLLVENGLLHERIEV
jgi:uncharacterized protein YgbK (DUF1537 family)